MAPGLVEFVGDDGKVIFLLFFGAGSGMIECGEVCILFIYRIELRKKGTYG